MKLDKFCCTLFGFEYCSLIVIQWYVSKALGHFLNQQFGILIEVHKSIMAAIFAALFT